MLRFMYEQLDTRFIVSCSVCKQVNKCSQTMYGKPAGFICPLFERKDSRDIKVNFPMVDFRELQRTLRMMQCQCNIDKGLYMRSWMNSGENISSLNSFTDICVFEHLIKEFQDFILEKQEELVKNRIRFERLLKTIIVVEKGKISYFCIDDEMDDVILKVAKEENYQTVDSKIEELIQLKNGRTVESFKL